MEEIKELQKKYCTRAMFFAVGAAVIFIIIGQKEIGKGLVLGSLFSVLNFVLIGQSIPLKLARSTTKSKARTAAFTSLSIRYFILAIPLVIALKAESINFAGVAAGLFIVQLLLLFDHIILNRLFLTRKT